MDHFRINRLPGRHFVAPIMCATIVLFGGFMNPVFAMIWYVAKSGSDTNSGSSESASFLTIQKALNSAAPGDSIRVADGVYSSFSTANKRVLIESVGGAAKAIVDGGGSQRCATCGSTSYDITTGGSPTDGTNTVIRGFTFRNGAASYGGGTLCGRIENCIYTSCSATSQQGGAAFGGILINCLLANNASYSAGGAASKSVLYNCTAYGNQSLITIGGIYQSTAYNCISVGNQGRQVDYTTTVSCYADSDASKVKFVNAAGGDFRLQSASPCVNAGDNRYVLGALDLDGNVRIAGSAVDIGCYEYGSAPPKIVSEVSASQRYPWNGKVDVHFAIFGDAGVRYATTIVAKDVDSGTNILMRSISSAEGVALLDPTSPLDLLPGNYHFLWDAQSDLSNGFCCDRVLIEVQTNEMSDSSPEFRLDLRGLGPWQRHTAWANEPLAYSSAWSTNATAGAKAVVKVMPVLKTKPKYVAIDLSGGTTATHYPIEYFDEIPGGSWSDEYKASKLVLRHIPAGSFIMGGRNTDYPGAVNTNLHMVTITRDFYMGVFEVTQRQWDLAMGLNMMPAVYRNQESGPLDTVSIYKMIGSGFVGDDSIADRHREEGFNVGDLSFVGVLRRKCLLNLNLPSEAQWEYACRAGTSTALYSGKNISTLTAMCSELDELAYYRYNSVSGKYADVGLRKPNAYGLYDLYGNVWECCLDYADDVPAEGVDPIGYHKVSNWAKYRLENHCVVRGGSVMCPWPTRPDVGVTSGSSVLNCK